MYIKIEKDPVLNHWWVHMDQWAARFRSLDEANSFVQRLNERINAPHSLAMIAYRPLWSGAISCSPAPGNRSVPPVRAHRVHA
ncbi:hypothetical protein [Pseudomonas sp. Irchel s3a18]|uniref:hypothetical protein n=1 Tax=Pseudomonas sp. Irchel s3a18 TaxID=2009053 RepID=UPI000BA2D0B9|nr:hypothetical protein [Pseudomonas sp. Irchel s3a18]